MEIREKIKSPFWKTALLCLAFAMLGAAAGAVSKLSDVHSEILSNVTSGMCVWIFIGVTICVFTKSPVRAAAYVFLFCMAMIAAYYLTAVYKDLYYSRSFVKGWSVFTLLTPIFAVIEWNVRGKGKLPWVLRIGTVLVMLGCAFALFPGNVFFDLLFIVGTFGVTLKKESA
ncbi:MAG: hypothetical protein K2J80_10360 [Oscillospiraceae bacterium]|nr:hypothetical protein [Oscillospiraceae bacterium]